MEHRPLKCHTTGISAGLPVTEAHNRAKSAIRRTFPKLEDNDLPVLINGSLDDAREFEAQVVARLTNVEMRIGALDAKVNELVAKSLSWIGVPNAMLLLLVFLALPDMILRYVHLY